MIFPISQSMLQALREPYKLSEHKGRAVFQCRRCATVFLITPVNLTAGNYEGLLSHATLCEGAGPKRGPLPARVQPFGARHER